MSSYLNDKARWLLNNKWFGWWCIVTAIIYLIIQVCDLDLSVNLSVVDIILAFGHIVYTTGCLIGGIVIVIKASNRSK